MRVAAIHQFISLHDRCPGWNFGETVWFSAARAAKGLILPIKLRISCVFIFVSGIQGFYTLKCDLASKNLISGICTNQIRTFQKKKWPRWVLKTPFLPGNWLWYMLAKLTVDTGRKWRTWSSKVEWWEQWLEKRTQKIVLYPYRFIHIDYHLVIQHRHGKSPFLIGKPSINGSFFMAMLNFHRV